MRTIFRQRLWVFVFIALLTVGGTLFWYPPHAWGQLDTVLVAVAIEPPFVWEDETGALRGFDIDLLNALAVQANLPISYTKTEFRYLLPGVATRLYDVASTCLFITPERQAQVDFTRPYFATGFTLVVSATVTTTSLIDLTPEMSVGVLEGSAVNDLLQTQNKAAVQTTLSYDTAFVKVESGELNAAIISETAFWDYQLHHPDTTLKTVGGLLTYNECGLAVNQTDTALLAQLDSALAEIKSNGTYDTLYRTWFGERPLPEKPVPPPPNEVAAAVPTPVVIETRRLVTATTDLAGIYYLTSNNESAVEPILGAGSQAGTRYQILTLAANGIWFITETAAPIGASGELTGTQTGQPGLWYVNPRGEVEAMLLTFSAPATGNGFTEVIRKDYEMQVDSSGSVVGTYHATRYPADLFALPTTPTATLTQTVKFTGQRVP